MAGSWSFRASMALVLTCLAMMAAAQKARAVDEAVAASGPPLNVALFVNSKSFLCYNDGYVEATRKLTNLAVERINARNGVRGRPIELTIYDNEGQLNKAMANAKLALEKKDLVAMIGLNSPKRAGEVFKIIAETPAGDEIPFISNIPMSRQLAAHKNVFTTQPYQEIERVPAMLEFFRANGIKEVAFLGRSKAGYVAEIRGGLAAKSGDDVNVRILPSIDINKGKLNAKQLDAAVAKIEQDRTDMLVLAVGTAQTGDALRRLQQMKNPPRVFMVGWLSKDLARVNYPQPIYGIDWATVPEIENDRIFKVLGQGEPEAWFFAGRKVAPADQWAKNDCNKFFATYVPSTYSPANILAAKEGAMYADMINLIATSARGTGQSLDIGGGRSGTEMTPIKKYRKAILRDLKGQYSSARKGKDGRPTGGGAFKGLFENWSFNSTFRSRSQVPTIVILPAGLGRKQLAPVQFVRNRTGGLKPIETLYLDIDLVRTSSVDNNRKSFFAEFFLSMRRSSKFSIEDITFANAFLDPRAKRDALTNGREISIDVMHNGGESDAYPRDMRVYKIAGRFRFTPDFSQYPFDTQQFSINLQPRSSDKAFIVQPPPLSYRDKFVVSEGWVPDRQYVSYYEDFLPVVDAFTHTQSIVPYYNVRYVWQMERETTDYYIRVIVPLLFILVVAYLSIFIPKTNLESIVTIQITALLAAVALYLSLPQIDTDSATYSDWIFMVDYMLVSIMIIISILRINARVAAMPWVSNILAFIHIVIMPAAVIGLTIYVSKTELIAGFADLPGWKLLGLS